MAPTPSELVALMQPWLRVLKKATDIIDLPSDASEIVYIHVETFNSGFGQTLRPDPRALEALHLLALLGEIDHEAWKTAVGAAWPKHVERVVRLSAGRVLQLGVRLGFNHDVMDEEICPIEDWYSDLLACAAAPTGSAKYEKVLRSFEAAYAAAERDSSRAITKRRDLELPVRIVVFHGPYEERLQILAAIAGDDELQGTPVPVRASSVVPNQTEWKPLLRIAELCPGLQEERVLTVEHLDLLASLVRFGADVDNFSFDGFVFAESNGPTVVKALQQLMRTPTTRTARESRLPVTRTDATRKLSRHALQAVYSAVQRSQSVQSLDVNQLGSGRAPPRSQADRNFAWQNIVYALFGREATHQISEVTLWVDDLRMPDVDAVKEMVDHRDPLAVLLGRAQVESSDAVGFVTASKFRLAAHGFVFVDLEPQEVRVLSETKDMVSVYLPGHGQAWVHSADCISRRTEPAVEGFGSREFTRVQFNWMTNESKDAVLALLRLVGRGIKKLCFNAPRGLFDPMDEWFVSLVDACPDLETLILAGNFKSLDTIANAFHAGFPRLKKLTLQFVYVVDPSTVAPFFLNFANRDHPMTQRLRTFRMYSCKWDVSPVSLASTLTNVVSANRSLRDFMVRVTLPDPTQHGDLKRFELDETGVTPISQRAGPLDLRKKLAFLSATSSRVEDPHQSPTAAQLVDSQVIPFILEAAAVCRTRTVHFSFDNWFSPY